MVAINLLEIGVQAVASRLRYVIIAHIINLAIHLGICAEIYIHMAIILSAFLSVK